MPDLLMERDELAATERSDAKILKKYARYELLAVDEQLTVEVNDIEVKFLFELVERRYMEKSTILCTQYAPAEWHELLGGEFTRRQYESAASPGAHHAAA